MIADRSRDSGVNLLDTLGLHRPQKLQRDMQALGSNPAHIATGPAQLILNVAQSQQNGGFEIDGNEAANLRALIGRHVASVVRGWRAVYS